MKSKPTIGCLWLIERSRGMTCHLGLHQTWRRSQDCPELKSIKMLFLSFSFSPFSKLLSMVLSTGKDCVWLWQKRLGDLAGHLTNWGPSYSDFQGCLYCWPYWLHHTYLLTYCCVLTASPKGMSSRLSGGRVENMRKKLGKKKKIKEKGENQKEKQKLHIKARGI